MDDDAQILDIFGQPMIRVTEAHVDALIEQRNRRAGIMNMLGQLNINRGALEGLGIQVKITYTDTQADPVIRDVLTKENEKNG